MDAYVSEGKRMTP